MLLMSTTRSLTSHVSYCSGIIITAPDAGRSRFGDEPRLEEDAADDVASVIEDAVAGRENDEAGAAGLTIGCDCGDGSGGAWGESGMPRRLPSDDDGGFSGGWVVACGGEYCVPTSTNVLTVADLSVGVAKSGLPSEDTLVGERWNFRERDDAEGDLIS